MFVSTQLKVGKIRLCSRNLLHYIECKLILFIGKSVSGFKLKISHCSDCNSDLKVIVVSIVLLLIKKGLSLLLIQWLVDFLTSDANLLMSGILVFVWSFEKRKQNTKKYL